MCVRYNCFICHFSIQKCCAPYTLKKEAQGRQLPITIKRYFTCSFWKDNHVLPGYLLVFLVLNIVMFTERCIEFKDIRNSKNSSPNIYYIFARATGMSDIH